MRGDDTAEAGLSGLSGPLVVVSPKLGPIARASLWVRKEVEGQELLAIPTLHVEQHAALTIVGGTGLAVLFHDCRIVTADWEDIAGFVGGTWMMWRNSRPELTHVGFVRGTYKFDIERAVRGITGLLT